MGTVFQKYPKEKRAFINTEDYIKQNPNIPGLYVSTFSKGISDKKVVSNDCCTMCYRCVSLCPQKAITLLGNEVVEQYRINFRTVIENGIVYADYALDCRKNCNGHIR